jgi:hypothetical protein
MARNGLKTICVDLPEYIASMLEELSRYLNVTPSQLLVKVLHPIYEVWRAAREADARVSTVVASTTNITSTRSGDANRAVSIDVVIEDFANRYSDERGKRFAKTVAEGFLMWLSNKGIDICSATAIHAEQYVNEVLAIRYSQGNLKKAESCLHSFLAYAKPRLCRSSAGTRSLSA